MILKNLDENNSESLEVKDNELTKQTLFNPFETAKLPKVAQ